MSRIVLVVREPAQALAWRDVLAAGCHEVVAVTNAARSARALLTQHQPQLVLCDMRLLDGTALAMIQWLATLPQRPLMVAVVDHDQDALMVEALRAGADNLIVRDAHPSVLLQIIEQTLRGETALSTPLAHALLDHFERARTPRRHALSIGDEQSPLQLEPAQRDLLMRLAAGYRLDQVATACRVSAGEVGRRLRAIVRKLQWDVRAGSLNLELA
ncbi:MAG: response regulator transcription factor [Burkholderiaceae bacterium]|nr:MAG: response regulator transcription factor [Burkholderiaceae bacterium]MBE7425721.1 response regulator transcription factor [Ideonella sp.]MCC7287642.1 response regulator transcription factor [Burkholderiaceae bacterium]